MVRWSGSTLLRRCRGRSTPRLYPGARARIERASEHQGHGDHRCRPRVEAYVKTRRGFRSPVRSAGCYRVGRTSSLCLLRNRCRAIIAQIASMAVIGYACTRPLYMDVAAEPPANDSTNHLERGSSQYEAIMTPPAIAPNTVSNPPPCRPECRCRLGRSVVLTICITPPALADRRR